MSMRYQASIVLPGYNPLKVANAPTIGTATAGNAQASVTFTAPACIGGGAISSYTVFANCGVKATTGASSPLVVTGLTNGTAYTFKAIATNAYGPSYPSASSNSASPIAAGQQAYITAGTYSWVAPACVTSVSVVAVGGGGGGNNSINGCKGGGGGGLAYVNNYSVTPGNSYTVVAGAGGAGGGPGGAGCNGCASYFSSTSIVRATGGVTGNNHNGTGGTYTAGNGGGTGGTATSGSGGGAGAAGYSGNGGNNNAGGSGGGAGGGGNRGSSGCSYYGSPGGGGVGILGSGSNGAAGATSTGGGGGSGGANGANTPSSISAGGAGGAYGGGGGTGGYKFCNCNYVCGRSGGVGGVGAVRIIWPGTTRSFPSTCTGNL